MAMCVQLLLIRYNITFWLEWVDSDSNLADGFSRDNMEAPWTWDYRYYMNSKAFLSQSRWSRCKNNFSRVADH